MVGSKSAGPFFPDEKAQEGTSSTTSIKAWASSPQRLRTASISLWSEKMILIREMRSRVLIPRLIKRFHVGVPLRTRNRSN